MANNFKLNIKIDLPQGASDFLQAASAKALKTVGGELDARFRDAMASSVWEWPRDSKRGVGGITLSEIARKWQKANFNTGSPRSINDTGNLAASSSGPIFKGAEGIEWVWTAEYAAWVHDGAYIAPWGNQRAAKVRLPERPWTEAVLFGHPNYSGETYDIAERLAQEIEKNAT
ncbi:hypothetical protein [Vulcanococcus sp.]|uniref:hypothetical protein n=1 Tax=Vulcanococcus sp. TaxID=2856995 RepID=UPI003C128006